MRMKLFMYISKYRELCLLTLDAMIVVLSYCFAYFVRVDFGRITYFNGPEIIAGTLIWNVLINLICSKVFKINKSLWRYVSIDEVMMVFFSVFSANFIWWMIVLIVRIPDYFRSVPVIAGMFQLLMMLSLRIVYRIIRRDQELTSRNYRAVILGAGSEGANTLRLVTYTSSFDTKIVGFIDSNPMKKGQVLNGVKVLGTDDDLPDLVNTHHIDTAYIAIKNISKDDLKRLIEMCRGLNLRTKIVNFVLSDDPNAPSQAKVRNVSMDDLLGRGELHLDDGEIGAYLRDRVVMVTGAGGSIGSELVRQVMKYAPKKLVLLDIYENTMYDLQQELNIARLHNRLQKDTEIICLIGSVRDQARLKQIFDTHKPDVVFHAAAHKHVPLVEDSPLEAIKNNVFGTKNVIEACILHETKKFVMISTDKAVRTTNVMGATKRMCELIVEAYKNNGVTRLCAVRFGNVLGSHGSVIPLFERQIEEGGPVTVTDPNIIRYFMTIPEAAQLVMQAGAYASSGEIFILDMGKPVKIDDLARNLIQLSGYQPDVDIQIKYTGLRPGEKLYEELLVDPKNSRKTKNNLIYIADPEDISMDCVNQKLAKLKEAVASDACQNQTIIDIITK